MKSCPALTYFCGYISTANRLQSWWFRDGVYQLFLRSLVFFKINLMYFFLFGLEHCFCWDLWDECAGSRSRWAVWSSKFYSSLEMFFIWALVLSSILANSYNCPKVCFLTPLRLFLLDLEQGRRCTQTGTGSDSPRILQQAVEQSALFPDTNSDASNKGICH